MDTKTWGALETVINLNLSHVYYKGLMTHLSQEQEESLTILVEK